MNRAWYDNIQKVRVEGHTDTRDNRFSGSLQKKVKAMRDLREHGSIHAFTGRSGMGVTAGIAMAGVGLAVGLLTKKNILAYTLIGGSLGFTMGSAYTYFANKYTVTDNGKGEKEQESEPVA